METHQEHLAIEKILFSFSNAFNAADILTTVASFTSNGINMPNNGPSAQGEENLTKSFGRLFDMAQISIKYTIDEIVVNGVIAFVRTNSEVTTVFKASGEQILLDNKELFIMQNENGAWKISHYIFNNTKTIK